MSSLLTSVHPELRAAAKKLPSFSFGPMALWLIRLASKLMKGGQPLPTDLAEAVEIRDIQIPSADAGRTIRLRIFRPRSAPAGTPLPVLLWVHGGGYIIGKPEQNDDTNARYARDLGIAVVAVAYRLAPEHPFPAALEDCYAGLKWVHDQAAALGVRADRIAIGGDSAGGGLAAGLVQYAHDRNAVRPVLQLLIYPMLDDRVALDPAPGAGPNILWNRKSNRFGWRSYLGPLFGTEPLPEGAAPARRKDLAGLPPAWIGVGGLDLFHDEDVDYARRLSASGVDCDLVVVPGAFHAFDRFVPSAPIVQAFWDSQLKALRTYLLRA